MNRIETICPPDLSANPFRFTVERVMKAAPAVLYRAWTEQFDSWFATPGTLLMKAEVNAVFFWEVHNGENRYAHYGRFLRLEPEHLVELTWLTGATGTKGAETVVTVELVPEGSGTLLRLTHAGFVDQESRDGHEQAWPNVLAHLDEQMSQ
ncbi:SRPBCC domain-containing protein [Ktedonosporobacter rubrisoli]|uniref:SRPBCC domain-containing protein n=1 Tax=Ktedonosporobacter rubrisoli TaxID=2509675 RepID=A0A4P6JJI4_KTERU|nr:SRPBCC domain-containing protein [Ktedonosporobacter rubrisoli]QBD75274.1 SRPBCC domain-containing protein [Ktedonosporobacter rubrisoli]